jgi:integrase
MASLTLKSTSPFYHACYRDYLGRQRRRSTHQTDREDAQRVADEYEEIAQRKKTSRKLRKSLIKLCREIGGEYELATATLAEYAKKFLLEKKRELRPNSFESYQKAVEKLLEFLGDRATSEDIGELVKADIVGFRDSLAAKVAPGTANLSLRVIKQLFSCARRDGYLEDDPCEFVSQLKRRRGDGLERRPFTRDELQKILAVANDEWRSLIMFGALTGQRLGDLCALTWNAIDLDRNELSLTSKKTNRRIIVPLSEQLREHVLSLPGADSGEVPLHPHAAGLLKRDGRVRALSSEFADILERAGLRPKQAHVKRGRGRDGERQLSSLSFHALRHTAVTLLKEAGVPHAVVQELIGHASEAVNALYTHIGSEALQKAAQALPRL